MTISADDAEFTYAGPPFRVGFLWHTEDYESRIKPVLMRDLLTLQNIYSRGICLVVKNDKQASQVRDLARRLNVEVDLADSKAATWMVYQTRADEDLEEPEGDEIIVKDLIKDFAQDSTDLPSQLEVEHEEPTPALVQRVFPDGNRNPLDRPIPAPLPTKIRPF